MRAILMTACGCKKDTYVDDVPPVIHLPVRVTATDYFSEPPSLGVDERPRRSFAYYNKDERGVLHYFEVFEAPKKPTDSTPLASDGVVKAKCMGPETAPAPKAPAAQVKDECGCGGPPGHVPHGVWCRL